MEYLLSTNNFELKLFLAIIWGFVPALIWLFFWLKQDEKHPEPNRLIIATFIFGISAVFAAYLLQSLIFKDILGLDVSDIGNIIQNKFFLGFLLIFILAGTEEILKYFAAYFGGLRHKENNEAIDPTVYLITAALGFAAFETFFYLITSMKGGIDIPSVMQTGNLRFVGAALTHSTSSALVGFFIGLSYYKNKFIKKLFLIIGLITASTLHSFFNFFIMKQGDYGFYGFMIIWIAVITLLAFLEIIKKIKNHEKKKKIIF